MFTLTPICDSIRCHVKLAGVPSSVRPNQPNPILTIMVLHLAIFSFFRLVSARRREP